MSDTIIVQEVPVTTVISIAEQGPQGIPGVALLSFTGDLTGTGLTSSPLNISLSATGISAGTYGSASQSLTLTVDAKGRITGISNTNISLNASALTSGTLSSTIMPALTGDLTSVAGSTVTTLKNSGITAGTYTKVTFDSKGIATNGTNPTTLAGFGILDTYTKAEVDLQIAGGTVSFTNLIDKPTTIAGYGITNAYTKTQVDALILTVTPDFNTLANKPVTLAGYGIIDAVASSAVGTTVASLVSGKIPAVQLPSYVDDVLEYGSLATLPTVGETGKIYVTLDTNNTYRWSGSTYVSLGGTTTDASVLVTGTLAKERLPAFTGDVTATAGTGNLTLGNSGVTAGTYGSATQITPITVDSKGRITAASSPVDLLPSFANVSGKPTTLVGYGITDSYTKTETNTALATKQDTLVSSINIKTINGSSILGTGDITISGGGGGTGSGIPSAFSTFSMVDGELIVEHSSSFALSLVDGEFIVEYT